MRHLSLFGFLSLLFTFLLSTSAIGAAAEREPETVADIIRAVEATYQQVETIQADFVQVTRSSALGDEQRQRGKLVLKKPRKMRWDFTSPASKLFVTDGATIWIWSPGDNQVIVYRDFNEAAPGVANLLTDLNRLADQFQVKLVDDPSDPQKRLHTIDLWPKEQAGFKVIRLSLSPKKFLIERVVITDQFDNVTELSFSQVKLNNRVPDADFTFQVPPGAEVINPESP